MWCLEIDTLSHGLTSITQGSGSAQCLVSSGRTSTIMVNLPVGFQMEKFLLPGDGVHTNPSILANRNILVPAKYLAPWDGFIAFTLVQGTNSRLDFFKCCDAFHWAAPLPAFPTFPKASFSCLFLFMFRRSTLFGTWFGQLAAFRGKKMWWSQRRMSSQSCFVEISLAGDHSVFLQGLEPAQQYQATWIFYSQWIPGHRSMQDLIMPLHSFFPCFLNIPTCVFVPAHSALLSP